MWFLATIRGDKGLALTLYGADGEVTVAGTLPDVRQYCLAALFDSGGSVVSCVDKVDQADPECVEIEAATGIWPPH